MKAAILIAFGSAFSILFYVSGNGDMRIVGTILTILGFAELCGDLFKRKAT